MTPAAFPHPAPGPVEAPFWDACGRGELRIQRCRACGTWRHPPRPRCPRCRSADLVWEPASGRGEIWSYTVCHPPVLAAFAERAPYNAIVVRLAEGPFLVSNLIEGSPDDLRVGRPVQAVLVRIDDDLTIPQFRPFDG